MFPSYYRDIIYLQLIAIIFITYLVATVKIDFTTTTFKENKKTITSVVAVKTYFATISTEVKSICCYKWKKRYCCCSCWDIVFCCYNYWDCFAAVATETYPSRSFIQSTYFPIYSFSFCFLHVFSSECFLNVFFFPSEYFPTSCSFRPRICSYLAKIICWHILLI